MTRRYIFTSESVSEGHPDKLADIISDTILDRFLEADPHARVACETFIADDLVVIAGEFRTNPPSLFAEIRKSILGIVRDTLRKVGYTDAETGIDPDNCKIRLQLNHQSQDIARGVDQGEGVTGAGDQGLMFGYATDETPELMPLPISLAHRLVRRQAELRHSGALSWLRPDAKAQVSVRYESNRPICIETVVLSTQHAPDISTEEIRKAIISNVINPVIPQALYGPKVKYLINPTGRFEIGGPRGDTGLTGRKIIVDTYGGSCPHGGGAFSGKDPSKVDRSGAYMARYIAKNVVAAGFSRRCTVQLAYAIGVVEPVSIHVDLQNTGQVDEEELEQVIPRLFDLTPAGIIKTLDLNRPIYAQTAAYGHFGRDDLDLPWERTDQFQALQEHMGLGSGRSDFICIMPQYECGSSMKRPVAKEEDKS